MDKIDRIPGCSKPAFALARHRMGPLNSRKIPGRDVYHAETSYLEFLVRLLSRIAPGFPPFMSEPVHLLIVDDEPDVPALMRQLLRRQVRSGELVLSFADDGESALRVLGESPQIDVVLTDINMPRMDGLTLLARMADLQRTMRAVVVTAYGDMQNIRTAMNRGAFDFLTKPIHAEDLIITIEKAAGTVAAMKRAERLRRIFERHVSDEVVATLLMNPESTALGGEKRVVTILMSDLRGFSQVSEGLPPEMVVDMLNVYLGTMADVISEFGGTVNEFVGDGILAIFGAPVAREDHADRAVACALAMQRAMQDVRTVLAQRGLPVLRGGMGIGLHTGEVVVGNIGSDKRMKYTPVGSNVNLASRIESFTVGGQILVSDATREAVRAPARFGRSLHVSAKGFSRPVPLHQVESIGEPFNLDLPTELSTLATLPAPQAISLCVMDGKHLTPETLPGRITHLSTTGARLTVLQGLSELDNLKVQLHSESGEDQGEFYAKVTEVEELPDGLSASVHFTAVPDDVDVLFGRLTAR